MTDFHKEGKNEMNGGKHTKKIGVAWVCGIKSRQYFGNIIREGKR